MQIVEEYTTENTVDIGDRMRTKINGGWKYSWNNANKENRKLILKLPNFDNEIFKEITGIDVCKELEIDK